MRRGDVRGEVLSALLEGPAHGYEVIRRLEEKSSGFWRPSAGSVYPTLQMLEDAGLARSSEQDGKRVYELTDEGRVEAEQQQSQAAPPWDADNPDIRGRFQVREAVGQLAMAAMQVARTGSPEQIERAAGVLRQARQGLYHILAED
jgi:DNA-binding PadR family transcriptional regulator